MEEGEDEEHWDHLGQGPQGNHTDDPSRNEGPHAQRAGDRPDEGQRSGAPAGDGSGDEADSSAQGEGPGVRPGDEVERVGMLGERSHDRVRETGGPCQAE